MIHSLCFTAALYFVQIVDDDLDFLGVQHCWRIQRAFDFDGGTSSSDAPGLSLWPLCLYFYICNCICICILCICNCICIYPWWRKIFEWCARSLRHGMHWGESWWHNVTVLITTFPQCNSITTTLIWSPPNLFFVRLQIFSKGLPTSSRAGRLRRKKLTLKLKPCFKNVIFCVLWNLLNKSTTGPGLTTFALTTDWNEHTVLFGATRATSMMQLFNMCIIGHHHSTASIRIEIVCLQHLVLGFDSSWWVYVFKPKKCSRFPSVVLRCQKRSKKCLRILERCGWESVEFSGPPPGWTTRRRNWLQVIAECRGGSCETKNNRGFLMSIA